MIYQVEASLAFKSKDEAQDFFRDCQLALPKSDYINHGQENQEFGWIRWARCYHDEDPIRPCELIVEDWKQPA